MKWWLLGFLGLFLLTATTAYAEVLGKTTVDLDGRNIRLQETNLGNFVADAMRRVTGADIAVVQATAFRDNDESKLLITAGQVDEQTMRDCLTSPTSPISILSLKPAVLKRMMERALSKVPEANTAFLQISGMRVVYDSNKPQPRVESIFVKGKALNFADDQTTITVAMPRELALGGSGYLRVFPSEVINGVTTTKQTIIDAIKREFSVLDKQVSPVVDGRLLDKNR